MSTQFFLLNSVDRSWHGPRKIWFWARSKSQGKTVVFIFLPDWACGLKLIYIAYITVEIQCLHKTQWMQHILSMIVQWINVYNACSSEVGSWSDFAIKLQCETDWGFAVNTVCAAQLSAPLLPLCAAGKHPRIWLAVCLWMQEEMLCKSENMHGDMCVGSKDDLQTLTTDHKSVHHVNQTTIDKDATHSNIVYR